MPALTNYNREEEEEKLHHFVLWMSDEEEVFILNAQRQGYQLDEKHIMGSLEELERYAREKRIDFADDADAALLEQTNCWYYLGEVVRKNYGGYWRFSMNEENTLHWGAYVIEGHVPVAGVEFEPLGLFKRFCRQGYPAGALRDAILADVEDDDADFLSHIPVETGGEF